MRKFGRIVLLGMIILLCVSCSIQGKKPESGFWYCEKLNTGIDFDLYQTTAYCVIVYHEDGSTEINGCHFDYGTGISFFVDSKEGYNEYFHGEFKYKKERFIVKSYADDIVYTFIKQDK